MCAALRGGHVIYSRKPMPSLVSGARFDEEAFSEHVRRTLIAARGCHLQFVFRDVHTLGGDKERAKRIVDIIRRMIDDVW